VRAPAIFFEDSMSTNPKTTNSKARRPSTRRERLVRDVARAVGKDMATLAKEGGFASSGHLYSVLASSRPRNKTLMKLLQLLRANGSGVTIDRLI